MENKWKKWKINGETQSNSIEIAFDCFELLYQIIVHIARFYSQLID